MTLIEFEEKYRCCRELDEESKYFPGKEIKEDVMSISTSNPGFSLGFSLRVGKFVRMSDVLYSDLAFSSLQSTVYGLDSDTKYCLT